MRLFRNAIVVLVATVLGAGGCQHKKTTKISIEGPEKKHELKIETTEKN